MGQPDFTRDELILLLDGYLASKAGGEPSAEDLSQTLRALGVHADRGDPDVFRNADGVGRAVRRFRAIDEGASDRRTPAYVDVWDELSSDPDALREEVARILARLPGPRAPRVVLQPSSNKDAREHYRDTIDAPVRFADQASLLGPEEAALMAAFPAGEAAMWGVTPPGEARWAQVQKGDIALFSRDKHFFGVGTIVLTFHNEALARSLWREDPNGRTWEFMYALDEVRAVNIPYEEMNRIIGYKAGNMFMGFTVLDEEKSERVLGALDLFSDTYVPEVTPTAFRRAATRPPTELDRERTSSQRTESGYIRGVLFPNPIASCDLCGEAMPREFLIGAHIKKRAACTDDEKLDIPNVVMAACVFGCDALFEKGYVTVGDDWGLRVVGATGSPGVDARLAQLAGRAFPKQEPARAEYFAWHRANTFKE